MNINTITNTPEYEKAFWNLMRNKPTNYDVLKNGSALNKTFILPDNNTKKLCEAIKKESIFRTIGTTVNAYDGGVIYDSDYKDKAIWLPEGAVFPLSELMTDLHRHAIDMHKLATIVCIDEDFVYNPGYNLESHLIAHMAKAIANAEEDGFIYGDGCDSPKGILDDDFGAEIGVKTMNLDYDSVIKLFFSVKDEYRKNAKWMMSDETALALRTLKDDDGNYLWNHANDTILGKEVCICNMPSAKPLSKPIAFGDFRYYHVINRSPFSIRALHERFIADHQIGYIGYCFLDGLLTIPDAVKVLHITEV